MKSHKIIPLMRQFPLWERVAMSELEMLSTRSHTQSRGRRERGNPTFIGAESEVFRLDGFQSHRFKNVPKYG